MRSPTFTHERELAAAGYLAMGVDEAGCGCLAGPVVAAACHLPLHSRIGAIRDSKLLSAAQRERLIGAFRDGGTIWAIGIASVEEIDRLHIRQATLLAMRRAIEAFLKKEHPNATHTIRMPRIPAAYSEHSHPDSNHSDAHPFALVDAWTIPNLPIPQRAIVHGDRIVKSIAAASIVAKVMRDRMMDELDPQYPRYGLAQHKGYATAAHRVAIAAHGPSVVHRLTFLGGSIPP